MNPLTDDILARFAQDVAPRHVVDAVEPLPREYANESTLLTLTAPTGASIRVVVKRYIDHGTDRSAKARLEYNTLGLLQAHDVCVPEPLYLDEDGRLFGAPAMVTRFIDGKSMWYSSDGRHCARELARMLARIHAIPVDSTLQALLLDANAAALWFTDAGEIPSYMSSHPDGPIIWEAVPELLAARTPPAPALIHLDYWMGNVLWRDGRICAVFDWEEAGYGDPAVDVGYCRMDMFLSGMGKDAADTLLAVYEAETGRPVENLSLWEYAAAPRCMADPAWEAECRSELRSFIAETHRRSGWNAD